MIGKIKKSLLGLAGEYSVAAELARRDIYAQLTLGNQKKTDLLIFSQTTDNLLKIEVKCKQIYEWQCKGINNPNTILIFVDFEKKSLTEKPSFYILNFEDWKALVLKKIDEGDKIKYPNRFTEIVDSCPIFYDENKNVLWKGCGIRVSDIQEFENKWEKIEEKLK